MKARTPKDTSEERARRIVRERVEDCLNPADEDGDFRGLVNLIMKEYGIKKEDEIVAEARARYLIGFEVGALLGGGR